MTRQLRRRLLAEGHDEGAYAILYAVLVVVLLGMGAIVVDFASVRQERRLDRSATDAAALGGVPWLNPLVSGGYNPHQACLSAWDYLAATLHTSVPATACSKFSTAVLTDPTAYCNGASPTEIDDDLAVGNRTVRVAWPIPKTGGSGFLTPEIAPGSLSQTFAGATDGTDKGCDRLGVAVFENVKFGLGAALGATSTNTQVHSVARLSPDGGPEDSVAALNVLNASECSDLITVGNGNVLVGPTLLNGAVVGPGSISVESDGTASGSTCNGGSKAIDPTTGSGSLVCASSVILVSAASCDGLGVIQSHALDPGGNAGNAYGSAAVSSGSLKPQPTPEGAAHSWIPVTKLYGCNTTNLSPCQAPATNYVQQLETAYGSGTPSTVYGGQAPYANPYAGLAWQTAPASVCANITTTIVLAAGNWFVNCAPNIKNGGTLIFKGGNVVAKGDINVASGGCLVVNTAVSSCPTTVSGSGSTVTSATPPTSDAIVFLRNGSINNSGSLVMPQTFVYSRSSSNHPLNVNGTALTLWTAPGAGAVNAATGRTMLEQACFDNVANAVNTDCMNSRFARLTYWSDYPSPKTAPNVFAGQGNLNVVGVFFTPKAYFKFTGGSAYTAAAAQFWADKLEVDGGAVLGLSPDAKFAVSAPTASTALIR